LRSAGKASSETSRQACRIGLAALHHYRPRTALSRRDAAIAFVLLLLGKEAQEYFLHFDRFLDNFTPFDALNGIWRTLFGR
jgi:hypothetical protein